MDWLCIRTAPKDDLNTSSAELMGSLSWSQVTSSSITPSTLTFLPTLWKMVQIWAPIPTTQHGSFSFSVPPDQMANVKSRARARARARLVFCNIEGGSPMSDSVSMDRLEPTSS